VGVLEQARIGQIAIFRKNVARARDLRRDTLALTRPHVQPSGLGQSSVPPKDNVLARIEEKRRHLHVC